MTSAAHTSRPSRARHWRHLGRHYLEMVLAMLAGMLVLGTARELVGLTVPFAERPGLSYILMATDMALAMAAWMRFRHHPWPMTLEMCAAMYVPAVLLPLVWTDLMGGMTFMVLSHVLMFAAMFAVLLLHMRHHHPDPSAGA